MLLRAPLRSNFTEPLGSISLQQKKHSKVLFCCMVLPRRSAGAKRKCRAGFPTTLDVVRSSNNGSCWCVITHQSLARNKKNGLRASTIRYHPQITYAWVVLPRRLELRTHWLRVSCSTNWAKEAYMFEKINIYFNEHKYISNYLTCQHFSCNFVKIYQIALFITFLMVRHLLDWISNNVIQ